MKTIYVAGASADIEYFEGIMPRLRAAGLEITFDWTVPVRKAGSASPDDAEVCKAAAEQDFAGVLAADIFWIVQPAPTSTSTGAWFEFGAAVAMKTLGERYGDTIVVASGASKKCIFRYLADHLFVSHDEAFEFITGTLAKA